MTGPYDDILHLPHHVSGVRPQQPMEKRAAQFSPFAALTGYDDAVEETARFTETKAELEEDAKAAVNAVLISLSKNTKTHPSVRIEYFAPDSRKSGGSYIQTEAVLKKIDIYNRVLYLESGTAVPFDDISLIELGSPVRE